MRTLAILLMLAALAALALPSPDALAFQSPVPRPTLDPAWVCQQLNSCPPPAPRDPRTRLHHQPTYIVLTYEGAVEPSLLFRLP